MDVDGDDEDQRQATYTSSTNGTKHSYTHTNTHTSTKTSTDDEYVDEQQQCVICLTKRQQSNHSNSSNILDNLCYFVYTQASNCIYNKDIGNIYIIHIL